MRRTSDPKIEGSSPFGVELFFFFLLFNTTYLEHTVYIAQQFHQLPYQNMKLQLVLLQMKDEKSVELRIKFVITFLRKITKRNILGSSWN